jgi:hypothetical protein
LTCIAGLAYGAFDFQPKQGRLCSRKDGTNRDDAGERLLTKPLGCIPRGLPTSFGPIRAHREARPSCVCDLGKEN